jgi:hypothetical protein
MAVQSCKSVTVNAIDARCEGSVGGIKEVYVIAAEDVSNVVVDATSGNITEVTLAGTNKFQKWLFRPNTGSYTSTRSGDLTTGNSTVTTDVALQFSKAEAEKRLAIQSMINGGACIIIKDMYGQYLLLGMGEGRNEVYITDAVMQSGTSNSDLSGFTLTFEEIAMEFPHFLSTDLDISTLLA